MIRFEQRIKNTFRFAKLLKSKQPISGIRDEDLKIYKDILNKTVLKRHNFKISF